MLLVENYQGGCYHGGKGYSYAMVDLGAINSNATGTNAHSVPIIPPSKGHGYDIYTELGTDKVLVYARFDGSDRDFPTDTSFAQFFLQLLEFQQQKKI